MSVESPLRSIVRQPKCGGRQCTGGSEKERSCNSNGCPSSTCDPSDYTDSGSTNCGNHDAESCSKCPCGPSGDNFGEAWCNGDCEWAGGECVEKQGFVCDTSYCSSRSGRKDNASSPEVASWSKLGDCNPPGVQFNRHLEFWVQI